ncbi:MAG: beta-propeller fold lactonase family protein [Bacteroidota bacterium]|nr:beta-propeller fold lactonase family protein [Bacteroidota bacterium]
MQIPQNSRRHFLKLSGLGIAALSLPGFSALAKDNEREYFVYIGTYTDGNSEGIYLYKLDVATGELKHVNTTRGVDNPSFLAFDPGKEFLYAVNEVTDFKGTASGAVSAFLIDKKTGELSFLNQQSTHGGAPCYVQVDKSGKSLLVANYEGGNVAIFPIQSNGHIGEATKVIDQNNANKGKKDQAHAHCIVTDPENKFAVAADLGMDKLFIYKLDANTATLIPNEPYSISTKKGAGPRHFTFNKNGKYAYGINELNSTLTAYSYNKKKGKLTEIQTVSTLPENYEGESYCADVHISPNGKFLYGSNRGHNSIVVFSIDQKSGQLSLVEHSSTLGNWPRNFAINPSGKILLVANQKSDDIFTFFIDSKNGKLTASGKKIQLASPVFLTVVPKFT